MLKVGNILVYGISSKSDLTREILGGKGYSLVRMAELGLNVPPAAILPCSYGVEYLKNPESVACHIDAFINAAEVHIQDIMCKIPLVSVRSGARVSMAGMMDTILNVGIKETSMGYYGMELGEECAIKCHRKLIEMFGSVCFDIPRDVYTPYDSPEHLEATFCSNANLGAFPNREEQLLICVKAVFESWNNERAKYYRKMHNIPEDWGTAVIIQSMVFGNMNDDSCTGVLFTRNPDSGDNVVTGEFLPNAQGEDVVAGLVTPLKLDDMQSWNPAAYESLISTVKALDYNAKDMQDVEFTVENGVLYFLQCRSGKRTARATAVIALDLFKAGLINRDQLWKSLSPAQADIIGRPTLHPSFSTPEYCTGIPASMGIAKGIIVTSSEAAINCKEPCVLVTQETTPDDIAGMDKAQGVLTMQGGATSHAAVVARGMNKPCVVGVGKDLSTFKEGQMITICGQTGRVWLGDCPVVEGDDKLVIEWAKTVIQGLNIRLVNPDFILSKNKYTTQEQLDKEAKRILSKVPNFFVEMSATLEAGFWQMFSHPDHNDIELFLNKYGTKAVRLTHGLSGSGQTVMKTDDLEYFAAADDLVIWAGEPSKLSDAIKVLREKIYGAASAAESVLWLTKDALLSFLFDKQNQINV